MALVIDLILGEKKMKHLHLEKSGLRGLAISESFKKTHVNSVLCGIVMRKDFVIDGFAFGHATIGGDDITEQILKMYNQLERRDINYVLISGLILSMYNIVNLKKLFDVLDIPIISVTYNETNGIEESIKSHFPQSYTNKLESYRNLGDRKKIKLKTGHDVFIRQVGCALNDVVVLLNSLTLQGSMPEPLRVSQLLANSLLQHG